MKVHVCGIDIGKTVFHLVGLSKEGHIVTKKRFSRRQLVTFTVNLPTCLIGIEACPGAHFLARILLKQGHDVKLMPAEYVRPFVKSNTVESAAPDPDETEWHFEDAPRDMRIRGVQFLQKLVVAMNEQGEKVAKDIDMHAAEAEHLAGMLNDVADKSKIRASLLPKKENS